jgi:hypothetical protein
MPLVAPARLIPIAKSVSEMSLTTYPSRQPSATSAAPDKQRVAMQRGARPPRLPTLEPSNARVASASRSRSRRRRFSGVGRRALVLGPPSGPPSVGRGPARRGACAAHPGTCRVQPSGGPAPPPGNAPPGPAIAPPLAGGEQTPCLRVGERRHCLVSRVVRGRSACPTALTRRRAQDGPIGLGAPPITPRSCCIATRSTRRFRLTPAWPAPARRPTRAPRRAEASPLLLPPSGAHPLRPALGH